MKNGLGVDINIVFRLGEREFENFVGHVEAAEGDDLDAVRGRIQRCIDNEMFLREPEEAPSELDAEPTGRVAAMLSRVAWRRYAIGSGVVAATALLGSCGTSADEVFELALGLAIVFGVGKIVSDARRAKLASYGQGAVR